MLRNSIMWRCRAAGLLRLVSSLLWTVAAVAAHADDQTARPNILWISCEDISPHLGCYGDAQATTPHLDRLAAEGVRYTHAFACHGVCAPSRTGIITGMHPISLGANHMRSKALLPATISCFPVWLRQAGYYCTNNSKTDYNLVWQVRDVWDESSAKAHWKHRPDPEQPFFAVFNLTMTHESKVWPEGWRSVVKDLPPASRHSPQQVRVPPLYPDTRVVREDLARLLDIITVMDLEVGRLLQELQDAGEADNTIVMFWSDHGDGLPRAKRWVYDTGTRVPLLVRIPERLRVAGQGHPGSVDERLVSLLDLGPTVLHLAGVPVPPLLHGQPFLGPAAPAPRQYVHAARDRVDERFDLVRSVRDRRFRYVRNLMPWRPALQHVAYAERNQIRQELRRLLQTGGLPPRMAQYFSTPRPPEELYDVEADPYELQNLAADADYADTLQRLRAECDRWQLEAGDVHLLPEPILAEEERQQGSRWQILQGPQGRQRAETLLELARQASRLESAERAGLLTALTSADPAVRWWATTALAYRPADEALAPRFQQLAQDSDPAVRVAAARGLRQMGQVALADQVLSEALQHPSQFVRHAAVLEIDEAGVDAVRRLEHRLREFEKDEYAGRLAEHALQQLNGKP